MTIHFIQRCPQIPTASITGARSRPDFVSRYSNVSASPTTFERSTMPAASRSFKRFERSAGDILGTPRLRSGARPCARPACRSGRSSQSPGAAGRSPHASRWIFRRRSRQAAPPSSEVLGRSEHRHVARTNALPPVKRTDSHCQKVAPIACALDDARAMQHQHAAALAAIEIPNFMENRTDHRERDRVGFARAIADPSN